MIKAYKVNAAAEYKLITFREKRIMAIIAKAIYEVFIIFKYSEKPDRGDAMSIIFPIMKIRNMKK